MLMALSLAGWGCGTTAPSPRQVRVMLNFDNVRSFTQGRARGASEWDLVDPIARRYHVRSNIYGSEYKATHTPRPGGPPGVELADYTVDLVVQDFSELAKMDREIRDLDGRPVGPLGERMQLASVHAGLAYRGGFVQAALEITVRGQVDPGSVVFIFDETQTLRQAEVAANGAWSLRVGVAEGRRYIYGYASNAAAPGVRRCFRVDIFSRRQQELAADQFDRLRVAEP